MLTPEGLCAEHDEIKACYSCEENERERIIALLESNNYGNAAALIKGDYNAG